MKIEKKSFFIIFIIILLILLGLFIPNNLIEYNMAMKNLPPSFKHPFGTDWLGRNLFFVSLKALSNSIIIGLLGGFISAVIGLLIGFLEVFSKSNLKTFISYFIRLNMSIPSLILMIFISIIFGRGITGVIMAIALTHWLQMERVIKAELVKIYNSNYINISRSFGKTKLWILKVHIIKYILPQFLIHALIMFPHAIIHESTLTFLGFGLFDDTLAIGNIISYSLRYLITGYWWISIFPGLSLISIVLLLNYLKNIILYQMKVNKIIS